MKLSVASVSFVCLGNICRSPLAKGAALEYIKTNNLEIFIDSAGTGDYHVGEPPCKKSIDVAKENGLDIASHRAKQFQKSDIEKFDLVVALDRNNYRDLKYLGVKEDKLLLLGDFGFGGGDIPDTYYIDNRGEIRDVYSIIKTCVENLLNHLQKGS